MEGIDELIAEIDNVEKPKTNNLIISDDVSHSLSDSEDEVVAQLYSHQPKVINVNNYLSHLQRQTTWRKTLSKQNFSKDDVE